MPLKLLERKVGAAHMESKGGKSDHPELETSKHQAEVIDVRHDTWTAFVT